MVDEDAIKKIVDELIERFNFEKVHIAMTAVKWVWAIPNEPWRVPTIDELKECARDLATKCLQDNCGHSTGGFFVTKFKDADYGDTLELTFSMADSWVHGLEGV